jgi:hypothetical protein
MEWGMSMSADKYKIQFRKGYYGYNCKKCRQHFLTLGALASHYKIEHKESYIKQKPPQLLPISHTSAAQAKANSFIRHISKGREIAIGKLLPWDFDWVRVWKVQHDEYGVVLRFEPIKLKPVHLA